MGAPSNPFLPPDLGSSAPEDLELARDPHAARPAKGALDEAGGDMVAVNPDEYMRRRSSTPSRTLPVIYKNPDGGLGRLILWGLAALGMAALIFTGSRMLAARKSAASSPVAAAAAQPAAAPVQWKTIAKGNDVLVQIDVNPREARAGVRLLLDGAPLPSNPTRLPKGSSHTITAMAPGYEPATLEVSADSAKSVALTLRRTSKP